MKKEKIKNDKKHPLDNVELIVKDFSNYLEIVEYISQGARRSGLELKRMQAVREEIDRLGQFLELTPEETVLFSVITERSMQKKELYLQVA